MKIDEIIAAINQCIKDWSNQKYHGPFNWVDDRLNSYIEIENFYYYFHILWVHDWNKSDREQPMEIFVPAWTTEDNIKRVCAAIDKWNSEE